MSTITNTEVAVKYRRNVGSLSIDMSADNRTTLSVDISTDARPICRPIYRATHLGRHIDRHSTDMSVEGCTKYTWSSELTFLKLQVSIFQRVTRLPITQTLKGNWKRFKLLGVGEQMTENKEKWRLLYCYSYSLSILMQFNSREVKWKWNDTFFSKLLCKSERISVTGNTEKKAKQNRKRVEALQTLLVSTSGDCRQSSCDLPFREIVSMFWAVT